MLRKVIHPLNLPTNSPWLQTAVVYLIFDSKQPPLWLWILAGAALTMIWASALYSKLSERKVCLLELNSNELVCESDIIEPDDA